MHRKDRYPLSGETDVCVVAGATSLVKAASELASSLGLRLAQISSHLDEESNLGDPRRGRASASMDEKPGPNALDLAQISDRLKDGSSSDGMFLLLDENGLSLVCGRMKLRGDFAHLKKRTRPSNLKRELLVRAAKIKTDGETPTAIDATAGLGEDSFLLAASGFHVRLHERNPIIAALLEDALKRASLDPSFADVVSRMDLVKGDSVPALKAPETHADVVLLDPMFPAKHKDASAKKKLQMLQHLERPCDDEEELLDAALSAAKRKVVVKRPAKGPYLAGRTPDYSLAGKAIRYDCIVAS